VINWDVVQELAKRKSEEYANRVSDVSKDREWSQAYNGYFAGLMECAGERESLRQIANRKSDTAELQKEENTVANRRTALAIPPVVRDDIPAPSKLGSFL
jgi:DNA-binding transcriptional regulator YbjK